MSTWILDAAIFIEVHLIIISLRVHQKPTIIKTTVHFSKDDSLTFILSQNEAD